MLARLSASGWSGVYDPTPLVYHHHGRKTAVEAEKIMRGYDIGRGAYYMAMLINPGLRAQAMRFWLRCIRYQGKPRTIGEILGGFGYLFHRVHKHLNRAVKKK